MPRAGSTRPEAFGEIVLKADGNELTRLKDVARIELGANSYAIRSLLNNEDAAAIVDLRGAGRQHDRAVRGDPRSA